VTKVAFAWLEEEGPYDVAESEKRKSVIAVEEFGCGAGVSLKPKTEVRRIKTDDFVQEWRCGYLNLAGCPWRLRIRRKGNQYWIARCNLKHADHTIMIQKTGLHSAIRAVLTPTKSALAPQKMIQRTFAALEGSLAGFTEEHIKQMKRLRRRMGEGGENGMSADERALKHTFGKIDQVVDSYKPGALSAFLLLVCLA